MRYIACLLAAAALGQHVNFEKTCVTLGPLSFPVSIPQTQICLSFQLQPCANTVHVQLTNDGDSVIDETISQDPSKTVVCRQSDVSSSCETCLGFKSAQFDPAYAKLCPKAFLRCTTFGRHTTDIALQDFNCVDLGEDCAKFSSCNTCAGSSGCGWCTTTSTCQTQGLGHQPYCGNCSSNFYFTKQSTCSTLSEAERHARRAAMIAGLVIGLLCAGAIAFGGLYYYRKRRGTETREVRLLGEMGFELARPQEGFAPIDAERPMTSSELAVAERRVRNAADSEMTVPLVRAE